MTFYQSFKFYLIPFYTFRDMLRTDLILQKLGFVVVALLFYVHGKHLRSCRDGQLT